MQAGSVYRARTLSTVHFTGALAQNAALTEVINPADLTGLGQGGAGLSAGGVMRNRLHEIRILSVENLAWAVELYASSAFPGAVGTTIDNELFLGRWEFSAASGRRDTADSWWKYWVPGLDMSLQDVLLLGNLYIRLINLSAAPKTAGAGGGIVIEFGLEPTYGGA